MPVFFKDKKRILFIHVPKTGGTSIEFFFEANGYKTAYLDRGGSPESLNPQRRCSPQHMHAALLESLFDTSRFDYVFMIVRHPIRRLLSKFVMENRNADSVEQLENWIQAVFARIEIDPGYMDNHLRPQCEFLVANAEVFRLEDGFGASFVSRLEAQIGLQFRQKTVSREMHATSSGLDMSMIRPALRDRVAAYYQNDFKMFGYH